MSNNLQDKMFREMEAKEIFEQAKSCTFDYADNALGGMCSRPIRR